MINIHILPASSPSRLIKDIWKNTFSLVENFNTNHIDFKAQHFYITSDEEIKIDEYYIHGNRLHKHLGKKCLDVLTNKEYPQSNLINKDSVFKKVILSTDLELQKDGVQNIPDEFLEWFINNSSCEEVDVNKSYGGTYYITYPYKIIIPKEEPKKEYQTCKCGSNWFNTTVDDKPFCFKCGESVKKDFKPTEEDCSCTDECLGYLTKTCKGIETLEQIDQNNPVTRGSTALVYKQETLEEVAERIVKSKVGLHYFGNENSLENLAKKEYVIEGAKWQQERSYSEEEVLELLQDFANDLSDNVINIKFWFNKFKKK
jgi:hypothetical protein